MADDHTWTEVPTMIERWKCLHGVDAGGPCAECDREKAATPAWLNGWPRIGGGRSVLIGTAYHCIGCGKFLGTGCVVCPPDGFPNYPTPVWPFQEDLCPVHTERPAPEAAFDSWPPRVADLYARLRNAERALVALQREINDPEVSVPK